MWDRIYREATYEGNRRVSTLRRSSCNYSGELSIGYLQDYKLFTQCMQMATSPFFLCMHYVPILLSKSGITIENPLSYTLKGNEKSLRAGI